MVVVGLDVGDRRSHWCGLSGDGEVVARGRVASTVEALARMVWVDPRLLFPLQHRTLEGDANGAPHLDGSAYAGKFSGKYSHRIINGGVGHNLPQEAPQAFAQAVIDVDRS